MDPLETQIRDELQRIVAAVSGITKLPSRWSGRVELVPGADFKGKKRFHCDIQIDADLATRDVRWSTLIHEVLHSVSAGYTPDDFQTYRGWEEGVVEQLQRLIRHEIMIQLGVSVPAERFAPGEAFHQFNRYIAALEQIRVILDRNEEAVTFYVGLLSVPIRERPAYILDRLRVHHGAFRMEFVKTFSAANSVLIGGAR